VDSAEDGDYFISNYRWHPKEYPFKKMVFSRKVNGSTVIAVWKIQPDEKYIKLWIDK
jgi:hypothetical protein